MNQQLKPGSQDTYPEWHEKPFRLSIADINHPQRVVDDFFKQYSLDTLRSCMERCLYSSPPPGNDPLPACFSFFRAIEKVFEAIYVLHENNYARGNNRDEVENAGESILIPPEETAETADPFKEEYGIEKPVFDKERFYLDPLPDKPMQVLARIFQSSSDDSLKSVVKKWQMIAISEEYFEYQEGRETANLLIFCEALQKLIEALYIICAAWCRHTESDEPLFLNDEYLFLSKKEQANPYLVLQAFKQRFPYRYARAEIWDLMHAVIPCRESAQRNTNTRPLMEQFELLLCVIKAPYIIEDEALLPVIRDLPTKNNAGDQSRYH
ncbi:MAG TPA: hypothetical protein VFL76_08000 [Edaphocola sp.]|nr:hypothetical protein [Edaphocola sp.]